MHLRHLLSASLSFLLLTACAAVARPAETAVNPTPVPFQPAIGRALAFLARQFDGDVGLFRRSPGSEVGEFWLAPDNLLALETLRVASADALAAAVEAGLGAQGAPEGALTELLRGEVLPWPPHTTVQTAVASGVWQETATGTGVVAAWESSSELALWGALNAWNADERDEAARRYALALAAFDGDGFRDAAFDGRYTTHTLALALLVGRKIGMPFDKRLLDALSARQLESGGFAADYTADGKQGEADTPTTALALLALYALRQGVE